MHARHTIDCDVTPQFTAAYLRVSDDEYAFIETHTSLALPRLLAELDRRGGRPEDVRWVVVTHAHLDHAAGASALLARCPNATLLAHPRAARNLIDPSKLVASATQVYGAARFAALYGTIDAIPAERVRSLSDGEAFALGSATLRVHHTAGHAKHHLIVDDPATDAVFTGDTFGLAYPALQRAGRFVLPSTSPTDFDPTEARRSLAKVLSLGRADACLTHFGEVRDQALIAEILSHFIDLSEAWLESVAAGDQTLHDAQDWIAVQLRDALLDEASRAKLTLSAEDWRLLATDIDLNAQGIAYVAMRRRSAGA